MWAHPGAMVGEAREGLVCGPGIYERDGKLWASTCGTVEATETLVRVVPAPGRLAMPTIGVGHMVLGRVARVSATQIDLDVLGIDGALTDWPLRALLRREDVYRESVDPAEVDLAAIFGGGELVLARVINVDDDYTRYSVSTTDEGAGLVAQPPKNGHPRSGES